MGDFRMPSLGADMDVGTIVQWLVEPGDPVRRGQIIAVVDTAKAAIEIEAFEDGVLEEILIAPGKQVPVGTPLARIGTGQRVVAPGAPAPAAPEPAAAPSPSGPDPRATPPIRHLAHQLGVELQQVPGTGPAGRITHEDLLQAVAAVDLSAPLRGQGAQRQAGRPPGSAKAGSVASSGRKRVTPRARRLAAELGVDVSAVAGSGTAGAVLGDDLARAGHVAGAPAPVTGGAPPATSGAAPTTSGAPQRSDGRTPPPGTGAAAAAGKDADAKAAMRTAIANLMSRSNAEIPHYYVSHNMDLDAAFAWMAEHNAGLPPARRVLPATMFLRATVLAAQAVPDLNGHWVDDQLRRSERVDIGVAVATRGGGLVTPAIVDAGDMGIDELMAAFKDLVHRARRGSLRQGEMAGASITMSSVGESGPDTLVGVIFPPQVALVGVGGVAQRPWAVRGMLTVRPTVTVTLAADHRATDGRTAAEFITRFDRALQNPEEL